MCLAGTFHQFEAFAKLAVQTLGVIAHHIESAAAIRPIRSKGCDDHVPTRSDRMSNGMYIALAIINSCQEVEDGTIMPDIIGLMRQVCSRNVGLDPVHINGASTEPLAGQLKRGCRNIQDSDVLEPGRNQVIHQS